MFKNLILLVLIALLAMPAATACSSKATEEVVPPAVAATEQEPSNPTNTPAATPTPQTTPPEKVSEKEPKKAISVPDLVKQLAENENAYEIGEIIIVSGIVEAAIFDGKEIPSGKSSIVKALELGPKTKYDVYPNSWLVVRVYLDEPAKVKIGDKITVKGTFRGIVDLNDVRITNGAVQ